jgi:site-specific DNA recombinase
MIRAAIYARFSSDRQNDRSVDDQIASCREALRPRRLRGRADLLRSRDLRRLDRQSSRLPGLNAAAEALHFDVIVAEDVDRISRDQGDWHTARKRLDFLGIAIHTASGKVGKLDGALRALMGEMFLENLVVHTRRGLESVIRDGRHAGGRAYGYRAIAGKPGELEIGQAEAEIVRGIFCEFVEGKTPREIAAASMPMLSNRPAARIGTRRRSTAMPHAATVC